MGYTTDFVGEFKFNRPLEAVHREYLFRLSDTRRMKRNAVIAESLPDPLRIAVGLPIGVDGEYFVGVPVTKRDHWGGLDDKDASVINYNDEPSTQPGLWLQWEPNEDGTTLRWNGAEKFYFYIEWLQYLIDNFFVRWNYTISGRVNWQGEEKQDQGIIIVKDNIIKIIDRDSKEAILR
jgi:hypothetical protein